MSENKHTPEPLAIGEYWSSSRPHRKVLMLSQGEADILMDGSHHSFIRWVFKSEHADLLQKQRDELMAALEKLTDVFANIGITSGLYDDEQDALKSACAAIASVKGQK